MTKQAELVLDAKAELGEGALWDERTRRLYWVDILGQALHIYDPASRQDRRYEVGQMVGTVVLAESGRVLLAVQNGFVWFDPDSLTLDAIADPEAGQPDNRFNDGKCDPAGRFWAGTMHVSASVPDRGRLYRLDPDLSVHTLLAGVSISNGIVWTADRKTMYYNDSLPRTVSAFDYDDATGSISHPRVVIQVPRAMGVPDGMAIDREGMLWIAHFFGGVVRRWNPHTAQVLETIELPVSRPSSCAFGGDHLDELYITTAREAMSAEELAREPLAGGLFRVKVATVGTLTHRFKG